MNQVRINVRKFLIHETGTYNQQYRRPYETTITGQTINMIQERLTNAPGNSMFTPGMFSGIANNIISPTATPEKTIEIPSGWNERRMRFLLEVEIMSATGGRAIELIQGYTNGVGVTASGHIAPDMVFFINTTTLVKITQSMTPMGMVNAARVTDSSHILQSGDFTSFYLNNQPEQRIRPEDLFSIMARPDSFEDSPVIDANNAHTSVACKSKRSHGLASTYTSSVASAYKHAALNDFFSQTSADFYNNARAYSNDGLVSQDTFISAITKVRASQHGRDFTFHDLMMLDPNTVNVTRAMVTGATSKVQNHASGQTAGWGGSDRTTQAATILSQSVPALAMEYSLTNVVFTSTNNTIDSRPVTVVMQAEGFTEMDLSQHIEMFISRLNMEVIAGITWGNQISYSIQMRADLLGETWITISLENEPPIDFVTPSFADGLIVPVLTNTAQRANQIGHDFSAMLQSVMPNKSTNSELDELLTSNVRI